MEAMKIYLLDINKDMAKCWKEFFNNEPNICVVCSDFAEFMRKTRVDCVVSPANSFGLMDGGYDAAITKWFGDQLQQRVQQYIIDKLRGEQIVGTSFIIDSGKDDQYLIHTPSMRTPQKIRDPLVTYSCMRSCLITAYENKVKSMVIPAFGGLTGDVALNIIAELMYKAYMQIKTPPPSSISWDYVNKNKLLLLLGIE
jgi:O-acetyl-ADP-ribose deacetylase (regulator of RNase III)